MKHITKRFFALIITAAILCTSLPLVAVADGVGSIVDEIAEHVNDPGYLEVGDGYITVQVSKSNGGFYIGTVEGDKLTKADNDKFLLYPDETFDTSFTSFRVTRNGQVRDYVFGRSYTALGVETTDVNVYKSADNAITAEWTVDGLKFKQIIALMGADTYQHGMAYISYSVDNESGSPVEDVQARVMMDTALGYQDYAIYMAGHTDGSYTTIDRERTISGSFYNNYFFAYDSKTAPTVTAYTLNATVAGETVVPKKVTFAHWNHLASTVFDYEPSTTDPFDYTDEYNLEFMTADSAVALYYSMGAAPVAGSGKSIGLYYGVYSNHTATDSAVAMNFTSSGTMILNNEKTAYKDLNGNLPGNFSSTVKVQNAGDKAISKLAIAIYPGECVIPYDGNRQITSIDLNNPYYKTLTNLNPGEARDVRFDFQIDPTYISDYRKIKFVAYDISNQSDLTEENTVLTRETYVLCPSADNAELGFTGVSPSAVFHTGRRYVYITGSNFGLLRDKSQYRIVLRPLDGGDDVVLDQDLVVINPELNTATLVLDQTLRVGTWQVIIDWNDAEVEDIVNEAIRLVVRDVPVKGEPGFVSSGVYGIVTVERSGNGTSQPYHYEIVTYDSEEALKKTTTPAHEIMIVMRGNVSVLSTEEKGIFKAEALTLMEGEVINLNDTLDVKEGRVTITAEFDGDKQKEITVDIDGRVFTTGANTKVWNGVCAITSMVEGKLYTLPVYNKYGEVGYRSGEEHGKILSLIWPSAAGVAQTLVGMMFDFRYGELCLMEQGGGYAHVVAFGAKLAPDFLVPSGLMGNMARDSKLEAAHKNIAQSNYSAAQLRALETQYEKDQREWRADQVGSLNIYIDDILFGSGGFIGFNTGIEVGIPSYTDGMPSIEGYLSLKIINDYWEVGVAGSADLMIFEMEAELQIRSYNGIPFPEKIYFFVGGTNPGIPVDPFGVFWVRGAGAGIDNIYESFFVAKGIPPLTLLLSGEFAIFSVLSARADLALSGRGIAVELSRISIAGISIIDSLYGSVYWYPDLSLGFGIEVDILDVLIGSGSIIVEVDYDTGKTFFEASATVRVQIPKKIFLIGGKKLGSATVGINTKKVWGSVKIIGIGVGITYYWGGGVDIDLLDKAVEGTEMLPIPLALTGPAYTDPETGEVLYMSMSNNIRVISYTPAANAVDPAEPDASFTLENADEDILFAVSYPAVNELEAQDLKQKLAVTVGGNAFVPVWYNDSYEADHQANQGTNAMLTYNEDTGMATVSFSFTNAADAGKQVELHTDLSVTHAVYGIERTVTFDSLALDDKGDQNKTNDQVILRANDLEKLSKLTVIATDAEGNAYRLAEADPDTLSGNTVAIDITYPDNLRTGDYTVSAIGTILDINGNEIASPSASFELKGYVNPDQPAPLKSATATLGGNYTINLNLTAQQTNYDGYVTNIFEVTEEGNVGTMFRDVYTELTAEEKEEGVNRSILVGGRYEKTDEATNKTYYQGLESGKTYVVSIQTYKDMPDGSRLLSNHIYSTELKMETPVVITPKLSIEGSVDTLVGTAKVAVPTINQSNVTLKIEGVSNIRDGYYILGNGERKAWNGKDLALGTLKDGMYTVTVGGLSETNDAFAAMYQFSVDTEAPTMLISSPQGGGFFRGDTVTVTGITEAGAKVVAGVTSEAPVTVYADDNGAFSVEIPVDKTVAYQEIRAYAYDCVGNESMPFGCTLTNELLGDPELEAVILLDGKEVTSIVSSAQSKQLSMAFKSGETVIKLNENSAAAGRVLWRASVIEKTATVTEDGVLTGADGAVGIVTATLDNRTAMAKLESLDLGTANVTLQIPEGGLIYDGTPKTPAVVFDTAETLRPDVDYTVSYANNVAAGTAVALIAAVEDGKCSGTKILEFTITPRSISDATLTLADDGSENPAVTLTYNGQTLVQDRDYTVAYVLNEWGTEGIVAIVGMGNYSGVISQIYEIGGFDHLTWIIPVAFVLLLGGAALAILLIRRRRAALSVPAAIADEVIADGEGNDTAEKATEETTEKTTEETTEEEPKETIEGESKEEKNETEE
ncbi:MAG: hypothetical protein IJW16_08405 [Clostridia bacterium]|nr:hypothetical protein [Clostridia bacterium]